MPVAGNDNLKALGSKNTYTPKQLQEMYKCAEDIKYFAESYCTIVTLDNGKEIIKLRDYQKELLTYLTGEDVTDNKYNTIILAPRQSGKCVTYDTMIKVKNKTTEEIIDIQIGKFHEMNII